MMRTIPFLDVMLVFLLLASMPVATADSRGIAVIPDGEGVFRYVEDFSTTRFFTAAFLDGVTLTNWEGARIVNRGPHSVSLVYRFHSEHGLRDLAISVDQQANGVHLVASNQIFVSHDGLDWSLAASSAAQPADAAGWQRQPLVLPTELADEFGGRGEVWVRLTLSNRSGVKTNVSNIVSRFTLTANVTDQPARKPADPSAEAQAKLAAARAASEHHDTTVDLARMYVEAADGVLDRAGVVVTANAPGGVRDFVPRGRNNRYLLVHRGVAGDRSRPSLAAFLRTGDLQGPLFVELKIRAIPAGLRTVAVSWDGQPVGTFDARAYHPEVRTETFIIQDPGVAGVHELRVSDASNTDLMRPQFALIEAVVISTPGELEVVSRPELPAGDGLQVEAAYYLPDAEPPADSPAVEGDLTALYETHAEYGSLMVVLHNPGPHPVRIAEPIMLDGLPLESQYVDVTSAPWDARGILWWRLRPRLLAPSSSAELTVRFRRRPLREAAQLRLDLENGPPLQVTIPYRPPQLIVDYVATDVETRTVYAYVRKSPGAPVGRLAEILLDGKPQRGVSIHGEDFPGGVALAVFRPHRRLRLGDFHTIAARTDADAVTAAQFRVLEPFFPLSAWSPDQKFLEAADMLHMNHLFTSTWHLSADLLRPFEERGLRRVAVNSYDTTFRHSPAMAGWYLPDEPDAKDAVRWWLWGTSLGSYARDWQRGLGPALERFGAPVPTICLANLTIRPLNWFVYGRTADIFSTDPYTVSYFGRNHVFVREALSLAREASTPRPMIACLEAYGYPPPGEPAPGAPSPEEWRNNFAQAIGTGAKGVTMWYHGRNAGGFEGREDMEKAIAGTYASIQPILDELSRGTPVDYARCDTPQVWVGTLLCGPDSIVIAAANDNIKPDPEAEHPRARPPVTTPAQDVVVTVQLPDFLTRVTAFEALPDGLQQYPIQQRGRVLRLTMDRLVDGRIFVLRRE